jgi:hypothetical protein
VPQGPKLKEIVLDIIAKGKKREAKKDSSKSHGRLPEVDRHKERVERDYILSTDDDDFHSIFHDYDAERAMR